MLFVYFADDCELRGGAWGELPFGAPHHPGGFVLARRAEHLTGSDADSNPVGSLGDGDRRAGAARPTLRIEPAT